MQEDYGVEMAGRSYWENVSALGMLCESTREWPGAGRSLSAGPAFSLQQPDKTECQVRSETSIHNAAALDIGALKRLPSRRAFLLNGGPEGFGNRSFYSRHLCKTTPFFINHLSLTMTHPPFVISRHVKAPRQLVWDVYTQAEHLLHWFSPKGVNMSNNGMDFRVGGRFHYRQALEGGGALWGLWQFRDIQAPEKIVLMQHFSDEHGGVSRNPWNASWPLRTLSTTTFTQQDEGTLLTIQWEPYEANEQEQDTFLSGHSSMNPGWSSVLDKLEEYLSLLQSNQSAR